LHIMLACGLFAAMTAGAGGCGNTTPAPSAIITRIDPSASGVGDTVTIFGYGFSETSELNVVFVSSTQTFADRNSWKLLSDPSGDEIESITFTVPDINPGTYPIYVFVSDSGVVTNTDINITIRP